MGINLELLADFEIIEKDDSEEVEAAFVSKERHSDADIIKAKNKELQNWKDFGVYKEVSDQGQKSLSTRWMVPEKLLSEGQKGVKARLVVRGSEEDDKVQANSPTASKSTLRIAFAVIANERWKCETIDIKASFLQGRRIERDVLVKPPREVKGDGIVWKLERQLTVLMMHRDTGILVLEKI